MEVGRVLGISYNVIPVENIEKSAFTDEIVSLHNYLKSEEVKVGNISDEGKYGKFFVLEDIDGNLFDVWEHHDCELIY